MTRSRLVIPRADACAVLAPTSLHPDHPSPQYQTRAGKQYCFLHHGSCEHTIVFTACWLATAIDEQAAQSLCTLRCASFTPLVARHGRTVDCTRGWISSVSKPPKCAACATIASRLGNAMAIRQPTLGQATCVRRATSSSTMTLTKSSCAKITTRGHTLDDPK